MFEKIVRHKSFIHFIIRNLSCWDFSLFRVEVTQSAPQTDTVARRYKQQGSYAMQLLSGFSSVCHVSYFILVI